MKSVQGVLIFLREKRAQNQTIILMKSKRWVISQMRGNTESDKNLHQSEAEGVHTGKKER